MQEVFEKIKKRVHDFVEQNRNTERVTWTGFDWLIKEDDTIKIINQVAEEYNNGWIPVSERLPDDFMSMEYLTTVKGHFYPEINYYCVANHKWFSSEKTTKEVDVTAWQPLPEAYQPKGE